MANILDTLRAYNAFYLVVDGDPSAGLGTRAGINSLAIDPAGITYQKTGIANTAWTVVATPTSIGDPNTVAVFDAGGFLSNTTNVIIPAGNTLDNQIINEFSGAINFESGSGTAGKTVINNKVTADSIVLAAIRTLDAGAAAVRNVVPAAGSFNITLQGGPAGEVSVGWFVVN